MIVYAITPADAPFTGGRVFRSHESLQIWIDNHKTPEPLTLLDIECDPGDLHGDEIRPGRGYVVGRMQFSTRHGLADWIDGYPDAW